MGNEKLTELKDGVKAAIADRDDEIKRLRDDGLTLAAIAKIYGLTRSRVQQIVTCGPPKPSYVYRCYDDRGVLLYVGCTQSPDIRAATHRRRTKWFNDAIAIIYERYPCREDGLNAERSAIESENPLHNVSHSADKSKRRITTWNSVMTEHCPKMIADLVARGYTIKTLAKELGVTQKVIVEMENKTTSRGAHRAGFDLYKLHKKAMRKYPHVDTAA